MADDCGLLNLATCIPQKMYEFVLNLINAPIQPLLDFNKNLLTQPIDISTFGSLWAIIIYVISIFYGLLLLYAGFNFIISGYDVAKREKAKEWFKNIILMIVLVQMSYFIYATFIDINSILTSGIINMIDPNFFRLTADNVVNMGLELAYIFLYMTTLLATALLLCLRYIIIAVGVVLVPMGIFLYFIAPLREYGKAIISSLAVILFVSFFDALIFLTCSKIVELPVFENFKILVMVASFSIANLLMFYFIIFSILKSAINKAEGLISPFTKVAKYFA